MAGLAIWPQSDRTLVTAQTGEKRLHRITEESFRKIEAGGAMIRRKVEAILGGAPGDYTAGKVKLTPSIVVICQGKVEMLPDDEDWLKGDVWIGDQCAIKVVFDGTGHARKVCYRVAGPLVVRPMTQSFEGRLRRLLRL
jgi:hypothetical protein